MKIENKSSELNVGLIKEFSFAQSLPLLESLLAIKSDMFPFKERLNRDKRSSFYFSKFESIHHYIVGCDYAKVEVEQGCENKFYNHNDELYKIKYTDELEFLFSDIDYLYYPKSKEYCQKIFDMMGYEYYKDGDELMGITEEEYNLLTEKGLLDEYCEFKQVSKI